MLSRLDLSQRPLCAAAYGLCLPFTAPTLAALHTSSFEAPAWGPVGTGTLWGLLEALRWRAVRTFMKVGHVLDHKTASWSSRGRSSAECPLPPAGVAAVPRRLGVTELRLGDPGSRGSHYGNQDTLNDNEKTHIRTRGVELKRARRTVITFRCIR